MKYSSILKFVGNYLVAIAGKVLGLVVTPMIFPHRDWIRKNINGVNVVIRLHWKKPINKVG